MSMLSEKKPLSSINQDACSLDSHTGAPRFVKLHAHASQKLPKLPKRGAGIRKGRRAAHPSSTEDVAVGKVLGAQVSNGQSGQHNFGARGRTLVQLLVDDVPLCIHNGLVLPRVLQPDLHHIQQMVAQSSRAKAEDLAIALSVCGYLAFFQSQS